MLPWKPESALPSFDEATAILVAVTAGTVLDAPRDEIRNGVPMLMGIYNTADGEVRSEDTDEPPPPGYWWVTEDEALAGLPAAAPADDDGDEIPPSLYAAACAFAGEAGELGQPAAADRPAAAPREGAAGLAERFPWAPAELVAGNPPVVHILARAPVAVGVVELVEIVGLRYDHGLAVAPRLVRDGRGWRPAPETGLALYEETTGDTVATASALPILDAQLRALVRAVGGPAEFERRLQRPGALRVAAGEVA